MVHRRFINILEVEAYHVRFYSRTIGWFPFGRMCPAARNRHKSRFNAKTMLLQVLDKTAPDVSTDRIDLLDWQVNKTKALHYLQSIDEQLHNSSLKTKMTVLEGLAAKSIIQFARDQQMDLIVLSSHGQSGLISGTTHKLIFSAPTSVLIIHASQPKEQLYKRILVPLDGSAGGKCTADRRFIGPLSQVTGTNCACGESS